MKFNIIDLFKYYFKNFIFADIVFTVCFILGAIFILNFYEKEYVSKTTIMLGACEHECKEDDHLNISFNSLVVNDYLKLIESKPVLEKAKNNITNNIFRSKVSAYYEEDTEYITIEVTSNNKLYSNQLGYYIYKELVNEVERIFSVNNIYLIENGEGILKYNVSFLILVLLILSFIVSFILIIIKFLFQNDVLICNENV